MSSPSRACVHSACTVYIALPSACSETTRRSGQATAAPVASGMPSPIEPPIFDIQSCGAADLVRSEEHTSELQSLRHLVCRLLLEKKKKNNKKKQIHNKNK